MTTKRLKRALPWVVISPVLIMASPLIVVYGLYLLFAKTWNYAWHGKWETYGD